MVRSVHSVEVHGIDIDANTRCGHWHGENDILAIKFKCCGRWYPCFDCHAAEAGHEAEAWPVDDFDRTAILCGSCGARLSITEYLGCGAKCPECSAVFNPRCSNHYYLYFETGADG